MTTPYIMAHTPDPLGWAWGEYNRVPTRLAKYRVEHSMTQGDAMTFQTVTKTFDDQLTMKRPIRFYTETDCKLFDGVITDVSYESMGNDYKKLTGNASGWWSELASMDMLAPMVYEEKTPNFMLEDLCRIANDFGMLKGAKYVYDTTKIPNYGIFGYAYETEMEQDVVFSNVYEALKTITTLLDANETMSPYDVGLRVESLETPEISEAESDQNIYIVPFVMREDGAELASYRTFKLEAGCETRKDYRNICNDCAAVGDAFNTQKLRSDAILEEIDITSNDQYFDRDIPTLGNHCLSIIIEGTGTLMSGWIQIRTVDSGAGTNPVETLYMQAKDGVASIYTGNRVTDGLPGSGWFLRVTGFNGCKVTVREACNDNTVWDPVTESMIAQTVYTSVAGRSIRDIGYAAKRMEGMWINKQEIANYIAGKNVRLYHYPTIMIDIPILNKYVNYDNVMGRIVDVHTEFTNSEQPFIAMSSVWNFTGENIDQNITGVLHQVCWDEQLQWYNTESELGEEVVDSSGAQIINYD